MAISLRVKKAFRCVWSVLAGLAALAVATFLVYVLVILPRTEITGAHDEMPFQHDRKMVIEKRAPDGTPYTVNNSTATFRLDVAKPDAHSQLVFSNYTAALAYCKTNGLPVMPSVQLVQGRLKQFDDALCAALEMEMAERRVQALKRLLGALRRQPNAEATEHVATALLLAGVEPEVDADVRRNAEASRTGFLATPEARPCGFWDGDERLIRSFQSDRYLMRGFSVQEAPEVCLALSRAIADDPSLREAFQTLRAFDARLTNPALSVSPEQMAGLTRQELGQRFAPGARFALISYSVSKEQTLIDRLVREGKVNVDTCLMALIIDAVRSGRLKLEPRPDSGWYDYQWHALETLLAPERGRESAKLKLTDAYKKRLENAFAAALAKARETQIKRLPTMTGSLGEPYGPPLKVKVSPDFSAEPTLTVYLRLGRGYRFLRQALGATLGEEEFMRVRLGSSERSVDDALQEAACFCYGLYERLCLEIGRSPEYLPDELTAAEREEARAVFSRWRDMWQADPALAADARVAVPVARWPDGRTRYWGAAGVRLEPVVYEYLDKPEVDDRVEAEFESCSVYLPTDLFLEFERLKPEPLTRAEFRKLCDPCPDANALRRAFGVVRAPSRATRFGLGRWAGPYWGWAVVIIVGLLFWRVRRARRWIVIGGVALAAGWMVLMVFCPAYRTAFLVRHVATINVPLGLMCEDRWVRDIPLAPRLRGLARAMPDLDPQVRYLAARFIAGAKYRSAGADANAWFQAGVKQSLLQGARDPDPEIAAFAVFCLGLYRDADVTDMLLEKLSTGQAHDHLCYFILEALSEGGDPRGIAAIEPLCGDSRDVISLAAIRVLGRFPQVEAQAHLWRLAESPSPRVRILAIGAIKRNCPSWWKPALDEKASQAKFESLLLERVRNASLPFETRLSHAWYIKQEPFSLEAGALMVEASDSLGRTNQALTCVAVKCLRRRNWDGRSEFKAMEGIISNTTMRVELARAAHEKSSEDVRRALAAVLCAVTNSLDSEVSGVAERALGYLTETDEPDEEEQPRPRRRRR